ncbi:hypothetical protein KJ603_00290 [Patescibacteria group bacterium]|nr:hypothetical protein [Patescibacteria group bacterium]
MFFVGHNKTYSKGGWDKWTPPTEEEVLRKTRELKEEWKKYEKEILTAICEITDLGFKKNVIDAHIVSGSPRDMSSPLIISAHNPTNSFVNTMTHELIHKLFTDNARGIDRGKVYPNIFKDMFPNEKATTQSHIVVHAILKYVYLDVLKDKKRLEKDRNKSKNHSTNEYNRAWEIVEEQGYLNLIEKLKRNYSPM